MVSITGCKVRILIGVEKMSKFKVGDKVRVNLEVEVVKIESSDCYKVQVLGYAHGDKDVVFFVYDDEMELLGPGE